MRYGPGSLKLNRERDIPLLRRIFHSEFITHSQLFELTQLEVPERARDNFNWRLRRLASHGLIHKHVTAFAETEPMYSISSVGFDVLTRHGEMSSICGEQFAQWQTLQESRSSHALGLNTIHIALKKSKALLRWVPGTEVQAENDLTGMGYRKDYDAVVYLRKEDKGLSFALEYERSRKTEQRYKDIMAAFNADYRVQQLVYIVAHAHLRSFLRHCFAQTKRPIVIALEQEFQLQALCCPAERIGVPGKRGPLLELLEPNL